LRRTAKALTAIEELQEQTEAITKARDLPSAFAGVAKVFPSTTVEKLMLGILQDLLEVAQLPLPLVDPMTLKALQDAIKGEQRLKALHKAPPEKGTISFVNGGPGTQIGHAGMGDIYHIPGTGRRLRGRWGIFTLGRCRREVGMGMGIRRPH